MDFLDLIGFQKRTPRSSPIDVRTNPGTYLDISRGVDETLQRRVPTSFRGGGIQNAPMNVLGQVSDISRMPPGPAREAARNQLQRNLQMADRLNNAGTPRPFGQGPSGSLRAPGIGPGGSNTPGMTFNPNTRLPGGGPFQRDYGMTRDAMRAVKNRGGAKAAARFAGGKLLGPVVEGGVIGFDAYNEAQTGGNPLRSIARGATTLATGSLGAAGAGALGIPTGPGAVAAGIVGYGAGSVAGGEIFDSLFPKQRNTPTEPGGYMGLGIDPTTGQPALVTKAGPPLPTAASKQERGAWTVNGWDPSAKRPNLTGDSDTPPPAPELPPPAPELPPPPTFTPTPAPTNLPPSPDQSMMDPYAYNLSVYGQGRNLATTKDERAAVRDLGLAINRKLFPKLNKTQDINPLMQATFPERYNSTLTGNIESRGTTLPGSMTEADSGSELATAQVQDTPYQAQFMRGMQEAQIADANRMVEQLLGQAEVDEIRRRLGM